MKSYSVAYIHTQRFCLALPSCSLFPLSITSSQFVWWHFQSKVKLLQCTYKGICKTSANLGLLDLLLTIPGGKCVSEFVPLWWQLSFSISAFWYLLFYINWSFKSVLFLFYISPHILIFPCILLLPFIVVIMSSYYYLHLFFLLLMSYSSLLLCLSLLFRSSLWSTLAVFKHASHVFSRRCLRTVHDKRLFKTMKSSWAWWICVYFMVRHS